MSNKRVDCPYKKLADTLREKQGVPYASAKLEASNGDGDYVEFFRGKDFARYFRANPEKMENLVQPLRPGRGVDDQIRDLMHFFVNKGLVLKTDRKYKRPKPGKPRLVKWPRTLLTLRDQSWEETAFYSWRFDRPTSIWYYVATAAVPILVILGCLFPLAPWWMRMAFIYFLMGLLTLILSIISFRYLMFSTIWVLTGQSFWLFPNLLSDDVGVIEAFIPMLSFTTRGKDKPSQLAARLAAGLSFGVFIYALWAVTPDEDVLEENLGKYHDLLMQYMDVSRPLLEGSTTGAAAPLYQQATAQRGGAGYDPTGGKARASQKLREQWEEEQRQRVLKEEEEAAAKLNENETAEAEERAKMAAEGAEIPEEEIPEASELPIKDEL